MKDKVQWKKATWIKLTQEEMKIKINEIKRKYINLRAKSNIFLDDWYINNTWNIEQRRDYIQLFIRENNNFVVYRTNFIDNNKNTQEVSGTEAINLLENKFKEINKVGLKTAFGTTDESFKLNIPRQFYYCRETSKNKILDGISAVDFSSHYPSNGCNELPDAHTAKKCQGFIKPNKDYKFAFYSSGHIAVYNEFDTHDWINIENPYILKMLHQEVITNKDEFTILMKSSKYTMNNVWQYFYDRRKENETYKLVLNASIGFFHTKTYTHRKYAHLAAIIIGRANNKMYNLAKKIGFKKIIHICVDGCIYKGQQTFGYGEGLNSLKQEYINKSIYIKGCNQYIISELKKYNNCLEVKHGGFDARLDNKDLDSANYIKDLDLYYKKSNDELFELLED